MVVGKDILARLQPQDQAWLTELAALAGPPARVALVGGAVWREYAASQREAQARAWGDAVLAAQAEADKAVEEAKNSPEPEVDTLFKDI